MRSGFKKYTQEDVYQFIWFDIQIPAWFPLLLVHSPLPNIHSAIIHFRWDLVASAFPIGKSAPFHEKGSSPGTILLILSTTIERTNIKPVALLARATIVLPVDGLGKILPLTAPYPSPGTVPPPAWSEHRPFWRPTGTYFYLLLPLWCPAVPAFHLQHIRRPCFPSETCTTRCACPASHLCPHCTTPFRIAFRAGV